MIISASRRTDIPAFYSEWLLNRIKAGYVLVPNPCQPRQISRIPLTTAAVDCFVFWTKNPEPMLQRFKETDALGYPFYVQFTLNPYDQRFEPALPPLARRLQSFARLSRLLGPERVVWRYDPVILAPDLPPDFHLRAFAELAHRLEGLTQRCVFSFLDFYPKISRQLSRLAVRPFQVQDMYQLAAGFASSAQAHALQISTCSEQLDLSSLGIRQGACIDAEQITSLLGCPVLARKDPHQRPACGCVESIDIGSYDCCPSGCVYCYATSAAGGAARRHYQAHDPASPLLYGSLPETARITDREMRSVCDRQTRLL